MFKEELKVLQAEREIRHTVKRHTKDIEAQLLAPAAKPKRQSRFQAAPEENTLDLLTQSDICN